MSVPSPATVAVGGGITSTLWNLEVRDALNFLLNPPQARLRHNTTQSIPDSTDTALLFNTEDYDNYNGHSTTTNTSRYVFQEAGTYLVAAIVPWVSNATGKRESILKLNGTTTAHGTGAPATSTGRIAIPVMGLLAVTAGDYVEVFAWQSSTAALNVDNTFRGGQRLDITWVSK